ncbi:MAG: ABC transporter permease [Actinomycetota bacterium]
MTTTTAPSSSSPSPVRALGDQAVPLGIAGLVLVAVIASYIWDDTQTTAVAARTVREAAPLILAGLCGVIGERSGIVNIGIEGQMLLGAFCGFMAASYTVDQLGGTGALLFGVAMAVVAASLAGLFLAWTSVGLRMDQIIAGTVINIFGLGATSFFFVQGRTMPSVPNWPVPAISEWPLVGRVFFDHGPLTYTAIIAAIGVHIALFHTRWGLRTLAVGEHPGAADTVGVRVFLLRYVNLTLAGAFAGLAGFALLQSASVFNRGMTNGKGFIALAVVIFGRWRPMGVLGAAMLFGFFNALQAQLQFRQALDIPPQFFGMIPFVLTIAVLALAGFSARPPAAAGQPYDPD